MIRLTTTITDYAKMDQGVISNCPHRNQTTWLWFLQLLYCGNTPVVLSLSLDNLHTSIEKLTSIYILYHRMVGALWWVASVGMVSEVWPVSTLAHCTDVSVVLLRPWMLLHVLVLFYRVWRVYAIRCHFVYDLRPTSKFAFAFVLDLLFVCK